MASFQCISVKISGNPDANSGFNPIYLFNNPSFDIQDKTYVGFNSCLYFYSIIMSDTQNVFKLVFNNVRSHGAWREGTLVIAISIPKNYKLDGGTPYDVLKNLKHEFFKRCMTCKDSVRQTYEYNQGRIDQHLLDDIAEKYTISFSQCREINMNSNSPIGYIVKSDAEIEQFFHDINYPEFENFSEVIIAESVSQTNYSPIPIQIPRPKIYRLFKDGRYNKDYNDIDEVISITPDKDPNYYDITPLEFTIRNLKEGDHCPNVKFDEAFEQIEVSTLNLFIPKRRKFQISIQPDVYQNDFLRQKGWLRLSFLGRSITINNDLSFSLEGEDIAAFTRELIKVEVISNKYERIKTVFNKDRNELFVQVKEKPQPIPPAPHTFIQSSVVDVLIQIENKNLLEQDNTLMIEALVDEDVIVSQLVHFKPNNYKYEGHFYLPKSIESARLSFKTHNEECVTYSKIDVNENNKTIHERDFQKSRQKQKSIWKNINVIFGLCALLSLLTGATLGYLLHDTINNMLSKKEQQHWKSAGQTDFSKSKALEFLKKSHVRLNDIDCTFEEIDVFHKTFQSHSETIRGYDVPKHYCQEILDYAALVNQIGDGDVVGIKTDIDSYDISSEHRNIVKQIFKDEKHETQFKNHFKEFISFIDIESLYQDAQHQSHCQKCSKSITYQRPNQTTSSKYICPICQNPSGNVQALHEHQRSQLHVYQCNLCDKYFWTNTELTNHKQAKHLETLER